MKKPKLKLRRFVEEVIVLYKITGIEHAIDAPDKIELLPSLNPPHGSPCTHYFRYRRNGTAAIQIIRYDEKTGATSIMHPLYVGAVYDASTTVELVLLLDEAYNNMKKRKNTFLSNLSSRQKGNDITSEELLEKEKK